MALASDCCICVRKFEYSETSQILTLLSRDHGLVRVIAKGAHRRTKAGSSRFDGGIDLLDCGNGLFTDDANRELALLTEWKLASGHLNLRGNLRALYLGLYAAELVSMLIEEHDPHPEIFDRLQTLLNDLATPTIEESFLVFELDLLREAGFSPHIKACVACGQVVVERDAYFSPARGGLICRNCEAVVPDRISTDIRLIRLMQSLQVASIAFPRGLPRLTRHQTDPLNRLLAHHVEDRLGRRLRMPRYVIPIARAVDRPQVQAGQGIA
jgi:DNA repair protein RecO (recombination protein O)